MRMLGLTVVAVIAFAARSEASCIDVVARCFCQPADNVGIVVTESVDGGTAILRVESSSRGLDGGLTLPARASETAGMRWLVRDDLRSPIDAQGKVNCEEFPGTPISADVALGAAVSQTCADEVSAAGFKQPPCNDNPGCSVGALALLPLLAGGWLLRRRPR